MSVDSQLDAAFNLLLQKAFRAPGSPALRPGGIDFFWGGGGLPLDISLTDPLIAEVPFACRLVWAHLFAGDGAAGAVPVQARVELRMTSLSGFGTSSPVYGSGSPPLLTTAAVNNCALDGWVINYETGDLLIAWPTVFVGTATWLALTLQVRPTEVPVGITTVTDNAGSDMTFNDGSTVEFRQ